MCSLYDCSSWPFRRPLLVLSHLRQQHSAKETLYVGILRFQHRQRVSRSNVQSRSTTERPVSQFPPSNHNHCLTLTHLQQVKWLIPRDPLRIVLFCAAFTLLVLLIDDASKLLIEQQSRVGSTAKLVIRLSENGQECAHLYSLHYFLSRECQQRSSSTPTTAFP